MKKLLPVVVVSVMIGYFAGRVTSPVETALAAQAAQAAAAVPQAPAAETLPFGFNRPGLQPQAPDGVESMYWSVDTIKAAHKDVAARAAAQLNQVSTGSTQAIGSGAVRFRTRNFTMSMLYRGHREQPVMSLTKVNSVWDDAEQHAGVYDFYIITGGSGEMIVGGKIANRQNLSSPDGPVPGEYRGQPIIGGTTYKVKEGDWLVIPPDAPHQPKPDAGGFSYMIMKINTGMYPWNLVR